MRDVCGPQVTNRVNPVWGYTKEGEVNSIWKHSGHDGLWFSVGMSSYNILCAASRFWGVNGGKGSLGLSHFHSRHLALRKCLHTRQDTLSLNVISVKAVEAGILKRSEVEF